MLQGDAVDHSKQSRYDSERLIQVATIANEISRASGLSSHGVIKRLVMAVESGELTSDLYPPFQKWRHGGNPERVEVPISNGVDQWRSIAKQSASLHQSDKDEFNHPNTASTYHILADDLFEYSKVCSIGPSRVKDALMQLAVRYNPDLGDELVVASPLPVVLPAPAQTPDTPAPVVALEPDSDGPAKRRTWRDVAWLYMVKEFNAKQHGTAKEFFKALEKKAGDGSPFDKGTGGNVGSLWVRDIGKPLALKTLENNLPEIRKAAQIG